MTFSFFVLFFLKGGGVSRPHRERILLPIKPSTLSLTASACWQLQNERRIEMTKRHEIPQKDTFIVDSQATLCQVWRQARGSA